WRTLRGPATPIVSNGLPDIAVPAVAPDGRWILFGLFANKPVDGLPAAPPASPDAGGVRLCVEDGDPCRAWPSAWPVPEGPASTGEMLWAKEGAEQALAYDVESRLFLRSVLGSGPVLEIAGRITNDAPRAGVTALFVVHRVARGRL